MIIQQKLLKVQQELKAPKGQYNTYGNYSYRSAEDILEAVKPLNAEQGLLLTLTDEPVLIGDWHYIKAEAKLTDGENEIVVNAYAREAENRKGMDHSQITGAASSYARKYALNGLYLIDDTKDADTDQFREQQNNQPNNQQNNQQNVPADATRDQLLIKWKTAGGEEERFNEWYAKRVSEGRTNQQMNAVLTKRLIEINKKGKQ